MPPNKPQKRLFPVSFLSLALTAVLLAGSCLSGFSQVANLPEKIMPDSDFSRMQRPVPEMSYDQDTRTAYAAFNTGQSLYVHLEITDPAQQRKIVHNGLELWIDVKGKKNK